MVSGASDTFLYPSDAVNPRPCRDDRTNSCIRLNLGGPPSGYVGTGSDAGTSESADGRRKFQRNDGTRRSEDRSDGRLAWPVETAPRWVRLPARTVPSTDMKLPIQRGTVRAWESSLFRAEGDVDRVATVSVIRDGWAMSGRPSPSGSSGPRRAASRRRGNLRFPCDPEALDPSRPWKPTARPSAAAASSTPSTSTRQTGPCGRTYPCRSGPAGADGTGYR